MSVPLTVYVGYDEREADAYAVCEASLRQHASEPPHIVKLDQSALKRAGWYRRAWYRAGDDRIDLGDQRPFSTDFAFTRFMVPALNLYQGWALFCDGDFLFTADIAEVFRLADDRYAVMCVKHEHKPTKSQKMDGVSQGAYQRKNWSSFVLWNCAHPSNALLTGHVVNEWAGRDLHAFRWLHDGEIGHLPKRWNWLAGVEAELGILPSGIHYTLGVPTMPGCHDMPYAELWRAALGSTVATELAA